MNKFKYFKVNNSLLDTGIKKSELWVYLTHCRHRGMKSKGYSIAGLNAVINIFGNSINKKIYEKSIESLQKKGLIQIIDKEINTGFYKSNKIIEIVKGTRNIQLPINLLDKKIITNLSVKEIKDIIKIYSLYAPLENLGGLDYNYIYAISNEPRGIKYITTFGGGFNRVIKGKRAYEVLYPDRFIRDDSIADIDFNYFIDSNLLKLKPVILEYDKEDEDLTIIKGEVFKGLVGFEGMDVGDKYIISLADNQRIIWILEPVYPIENPMYKQYIENREKAKQRAVTIYHDIDKTTQKEVVRKIFYAFDLPIFIEDNLLDREDIKSNRILELLNILRHNYSTNSIDELKEEKELVRYKIDEEMEYIQSENIRISKETGKRRRHTTSKVLKELKNFEHDLDKRINYIENIENELMEIVPNWVIDRILLQEE